MYTVQGTKVIELEYGDAVELVYQGTVIGNAQNHPMHLHGYSFFLVGTGLGNFNNTADPDNDNLNDPPEVNTIQLPKKGWAAIRFVADNPGVFSISRSLIWLFVCFLYIYLYLTKFGGMICFRGMAFALSF